MSLLGPRPAEPEPKPERDAWYSCTKCEFKTKQRRGLSEVLHNCPKTRGLNPCKED